MPVNYYERLTQVKRYIHQHLDEPLNRDELAQIAGFSVPHFHRIFKAHVGETTTAYVRRMRMERAAHQLLTNGQNITDLALDSGYQTLSAFGKAFNQLMGFLDTHQLIDKMQHCIAIYPDECEPGCEARFDAGAIFPEGVEPEAEDGLAEIAKVTQGLVYHYFAHQHIYGWAPPQERMPEINTRTMERILETLLAKDGRPLTEARTYENRLVGCCRDFSLLACAILRHQGRAARVRHGFASYFVPDYWVDHVIVEVWDTDRWRRLDPQLPGQQDWGFDTLDMPAEVFVTGGRAWRMCRFENEDPDRFGLGPDETQVRGWWFIRERLQQDVAALNKVELLCWDGWDGLVDGRPEDDAILDEMAALSLNPDSSELREKCQSDKRWQIPAAVRCFHPAVGSSMVTVA